MYPTGYSDKPIDFSRSSQAMLHSALQMKLADVRKQEGDLSETQKWMMKAMDINVLPELATDLQTGFQKDIDGFHTKVRDKVKASFDNGGHGLSVKDAVEIEGEGVALKNKMVRSKLDLGRIEELQKTILPLKSDDNIYRDKSLEELGRITGAVHDRKDEYKSSDGTIKSVAGSLSSLPVDYLRSFDKDKYKRDWMDKNMHTIGTTGVDIGGKEVIKRNEPELYSKYREGVLNNSNTAKDFQKKDEYGVPVTGQYDENAIKEDYKNFRKTYMPPVDTKPYKGRTTSPDQTTVDEGYTSFGNRQFEKVVKMSATNSATERSVKGAKDDNGEEINDENPRAYTAVAASVDKDTGLPVINAVIKGGGKTNKDSKPFFQFGKNEYDNPNLIYGNKEAQQKADKDFGKGFQVQGNGELVKKGNGYELQYAVVKPAETHGIKQFFGSDVKDKPEEKKTVSFPLEQAQDANKQSWVSLPWTNFNKGLLSKADRNKVMTGTGQTVEQYFDGIAKNGGSKPQQPAQTTGKPKSVKIDDDFSQYIVKKK